MLNVLWVFLRPASTLPHVPRRGLRWQHPQYPGTFCSQLSSAVGRYQQEMSEQRAFVRSWPIWAELRLPVQQSLPYSSIWLLPGGLQAPSRHKPWLLHHASWLPPHTFSFWKGSLCSAFPNHPLWCCCLFPERTLKTTVIESPFLFQWLLGLGLGPSVCTPHDRHCTEKSTA
jgi:hypothetical protein